MMRLQVLTHSGRNLELTVENFDAAKLNEQLNNNDIQSVEIGGVIIARFEVKMIIPVDENVQEVISS